MNGGDRRLVLLLGAAWEVMHDAVGHRLLLAFERRDAPTLPGRVRAPGRLVGVRGRIKIRVGQIVYLTFSKDETLMRFGFPKSQREYLVQTDQETVMWPDEANMRFHWVVARMDMLEA